MIDFDTDIVEVRLDGQKKELRKPQSSCYTLLAFDGLDSSFEHVVNVSTSTSLANIAVAFATCVTCRGCEPSLTQTLHSIDDPPPSSSSTSLSGQYVVSDRQAAYR